MTAGIVDLHVHSAPSLLPRRYSDPELMRVAKQAGVTTVVLKAHQGSTVERAKLVGQGAVGGLVLNSPVGGANPDAVHVAASLGGRVVWLPTASAAAHIAASTQAELSVHRTEFYTEVPVCEGGRLRAEYYPVFEAVAAHDLVLGSGHVSMDETICAFKVASSLGVKRLLVNHPLMPFLGWRDAHAEAFKELEARIEVGVLADHLSSAEVLPTEYYVSRYPSELLVFGSDLGHTSFPEYRAGIEAWIERVEPVVGEKRLDDMIKKNGQELLGA